MRIPTADGNRYTSGLILLGIDVLTGRIVFSSPLTKHLRSLTICTLEGITPLQLVDNEVTAQILDCVPHVTLTLFAAYLIMNSIAPFSARNVALRPSSTYL